jgi:hypothetical protein
MVPRSCLAPRKLLAVCDNDERLHSIDSAVRTEDVIIDNIHDTHLLRVGNPRLYEHPYQSSQSELWLPNQVEWFVIIQTTPYGSRPARVLAMQLPFLEEEA